MPTQTAEPCANWYGEVRHLSNDLSNGEGKALCSPPHDPIRFLNQDAIDREAQGHPRLTTFVIADLPACKKCVLAETKLEG